MSRINHLVGSHLVGVAAGHIRQVGIVWDREREPFFSLFHLGHGKGKAVGLGQGNGKVEFTSP